VINRVQQKHKKGCGPALLAMVCGQEYDEVVRHYGIDFEESGLSYYALDAYLVDRGFAIARKFKYYGFANGPERSPWPCEPFADLHLVEAQVYETSKTYHFVAMLRDGTCIDPIFEEPRKLSDYFKILSIAGLYRVGP
jgi:hypothetical protein